MFRTTEISPVISRLKFLKKDNVSLFVYVPEMNRDKRWVRCRSFYQSLRRFLLSFSRLRRSRTVYIQSSLDLHDVR